MWLRVTVYESKLTSNGISVKMRGCGITVYAKSKMSIRERGWGLWDLYYRICVNVLVNGKQVQVRDCYAKYMRQHSLL